MKRCVQPIAFSAFAIATLCQFATSSAEVTSQSDSSFAVHHEITIAQPVASVYSNFLRIGSWWHPDHTWSGDAANLSLDPSPGGLFLETLPDGGFSEHMRVIAAQPQKLVRMTGGLGPLQQSAVTGVMSVQFQSSRDDSTVVVVDYSVAGALPAKVSDIAPAVDHVIGEQFSRLKRVSQGSAASAAELPSKD